MGLLGKCGAPHHLVLVTEEHTLQLLVLWSNVPILFAPFVLGGIGSPGRLGVAGISRSWLTGGLGVGEGLVVVLLWLSPVGLADSRYCVVVGVEIAGTIGHLVERVVVAINGHVEDVRHGEGNRSLQKSVSYAYRLRIALTEMVGRSYVEGMVYDETCCDLNWRPQVRPKLDRHLQARGN